MPTTDSPAATIIASCNEVLAAEGAQYTYWGRKAQDLARDLRGAVEAGKRLSTEARSGLTGGSLYKAHLEYQHTLTTIAERGESTDD